MAGVMAMVGGDMLAMVVGMVVGYAVVNAVAVATMAVPEKVAA